MICKILVKNIKERFYFTYCIIFLLILVFPSKLNAQNFIDKKRKRICLIHSYNSNFPTYTHVSKAINEFVDTTHHQIDVEFMNSKEFASDDYMSHFHKLFCYKLSKRKTYDLFLVADDYALEYVLKYQNKIFKDTPIVFWGINNISLAVEQNKNQFCTGVVEAISMKETVGLAKKLNPNLEEIIVVSDNTITCKTCLENLDDVQDTSFSVNRDMLNLSGLTYVEFVNNLKKLEGDKKAILLVSMYRDKLSEYKPFFKGLSLLKTNTTLPIYHLWKHGFDNGILGGKVIHHYRQAQEALKMANKILDGQNVSDIPVLEKSPNQYFVDYNVLDQIKLVPDVLPDNWIIINRPDPKIYLSKRSLYLLLSASLFVFCLLFFLIYYAKRENSLKKKLIQAQKDANKVDELKNAFLSNISHEIRTPMNGILGFSEFLALPDVSDEDRIEYIDIISENSNQLLNVVDEIIDIAKVQSGNTEIKMELINIDTLLLEIEYEYKIRAERRNIKFMLMNSNVVKSVYADKQYLLKILRKLMDNAIKFTHDGRVEIGYYRKADFIEFYVKDTGIGISNELTHIIFDNFRQVQESDIREYGGLGLGLSITKAFVKSMGGKIWVESKENEGSCFYFTLPNRDQYYASLISADIYSHN